ncbi:hypothetical protein [Marinobacter adhaerens]|uniref:hypothetical protein n=1 Tax=Marinobacter adhaerens TaxID=1033846 RepID=UPI001C565D30|nr:hypothetical protein [Marinobacter adhaerens]MBW3225496.1 hypothetical protein [Marinobacter adhaerens]
MASSKSLGTLSLDLVAKVAGFEQGMDKAERKSKKTAKQIEKYSSQIGTAIAAGSAAAVTGMAALVASTANSAREIENLARLAGSSPQEFQKLTYGAKRFGVEQSKVSDILKDTNDRIGDFIQTGGGPMADFFENIAPKVGVTADEFARLSGPDALQLYVKSLEQAGLSQKDMTFYMEAIASDASALIPLLQDNGRLMGKLGDEAERTGNVFSDLEFDQLESVRRGMDELTGAATGMKNEIALAALPAVEDLIDLLTDESTIESAQALGSAIVTSMNFVVQAIDGAVKVTQFLAEELAAFVHGPAFDDIPRLTEKLDGLNEALEEQETRLERLKQTPNLVPVEVIANEEERLRRLKVEAKATLDLIESARAAQASAGAGTGVSPVDASKVSAILPPPTAGGSGTGAGSNSDLENELAQRRQTLIQSFETEKQEILRIFGERDEEISALRDESLLSEMEAADLRIKNEQNMQDKLSEIRRSAANEEAQLQQQRQALILAGTEGLFGSLADLTATFSGEQTALYKTMFAVQKAAAIAQSIVAINTGIAQAAAVPFPANLAAMASVAAATTGLVGNIQSVGLNLTGQAHDGIDRVPREGTWLLDQDERVLTAPQADKLDSFLASQRLSGGRSDNIEIHNYGDSQVRTQRGKDGQLQVIIEAVDQHLTQGLADGTGKVNQTMQRVYGLTRKGY